MMRQTRLVFSAVVLLLMFGALHRRASAQEPGVCSLGAVKDHVMPMYPINLGARIVEGTVTVIADFGENGHASNVRAVNGPTALRFQASAYVNGWRAEAGEARKGCVINVAFRFDGSQGVCKSTNPVQVRAEHVDDTLVVLHLGCDLW